MLTVLQCGARFEIPLDHPLVAYLQSLVTRNLLDTWGYSSRRSNRERCKSSAVFECKEKMPLSTKSALFISSACYIPDPAMLSVNRLGLSFGSRFLLKIHNENSFALCRRKALRFENVC